MIGVVVRMKADAADGGGQQAHFLSTLENVVRSVHVLYSMQPSSVDGPAVTSGLRREACRGRLARALAALLVHNRRAAAGQPIDERDLDEAIFTTDLGQLAASCRP